MFVDNTEPGGAGGEPWMPTCRSCREPIAPGQPTTQVRFDPHPTHRLEDMNGLYHADCARPIMSLKRAHDMLSRWAF